MTTSDAATEQWLTELLATAQPLTAEQFDLIRRTYGRAQLDHDHDAMASKAA